MEEQLIFPATLPPDDKQKRLALIVALLLPVPFIAIIPIGQIQLPRIDSYIPVVDTVMFINDSIAATLLFAQFSIMRSPSLLASRKTRAVHLAGSPQREQIAPDHVDHRRRRQGEHDAEDAE